MAPSSRPRLAAPAWQVWVALLAVYIIWGSTYLGIRVMVETMPPLLSAGVRFGVAGLIVSGVLVLRGGLARIRVSRAELAGAALIGVILLGIGNGGVTMGERDLASGLVALIMGIIPLLILLLRRASGERVPRASMWGVGIGLFGLGVLVAPMGIEGTLSPVGLGLVLMAALFWSVGAMLSRRITLPQDPFVSTAYQLMAGGLISLVLGVADGELVGLDPHAWSSNALVALAYLMVIGSLLGYTAYTWLLQHAPVSKAATYAYVNPVVAVALGSLLLHEEVSVPMLIGALLIVTSVAFIIRSESAPGDAAQRIGEGAPAPDGPAVPALAVEGRPGG